MTYVIAYAAIGLAVLVLVLRQDRARTTSRDLSIQESLEALRERQRGPVGKFARKVLVPALAGLLTIAGWPVALAIYAKDLYRRPHQADLDEGGFEVVRSDLIERVSIEQIEERERVEDPLRAVPDLPFGHLYGVWAEFRDALKSGDEIWSFEATREYSWGSIAVRAGYAVIRDNKVGPHIVVTVK